MRADGPAVVGLSLSRPQEERRKVYEREARALLKDVTFLLVSALEQARPHERRQILILT